MTSFKLTSFEQKHWRVRARVRVCVSRCPCRTVLTAAVTSGQLSIAAELVSHGAPFAGEAAGLKAAAAEGRVGELQRLLDAGVPADYAEVGWLYTRTQVELDSTRVLV